MSWQSIVGHDRLVKIFANAFARGRLGHAYCFLGEAGVGKHTFARQLAKTVLCEKPGAAFDSCDNCSSCHLIDAGTHPDLFMVARPPDKQEFPIDVIKEQLLPNLALKPARGMRKVAILDDADDLNEEAANCFLKTLEEPPPGSLLILVGGTNVEGQLPTIVSRCQVIQFNPMAPADVRRVLALHEVTDPVRQERLVQLAGGSPGRALALDDDEIWAFRSHLLEMLARPHPDLAVEAKAWMEFIANAGKDSAPQRRRANFVFRILLATLQSAMRIACGMELEQGADAVSLRKISARVGEANLLKMIERTLQADLQNDRRVQLVLVVEAYLDALAR